jgi:hypothetical protein
MSYRTIMSIAAIAILACSCVATDASARVVRGGAVGVGRVGVGVGRVGVGVGRVGVGVGVGLGAAAVVGRRYGGGVWYGTGRRFWRGQWYDYGVGSCWALAPVGYVWICQ